MVAVLLQVVLVSAGLLTFGYLLVDVFAPRTADLWLRFGLAFPALVTFVFVVMVAHMTSGGEVFERPGLVRAVTIVSAGILATRKLRIGGALRPPSLETAILLGLVALAPACSFQPFPVRSYDARRPSLWTKGGRFLAGM